MNSLVDNHVQTNATYQEHRIGRTLYRVTNEYSGQVSFSKVLEDLIVQKILHRENNSLERG